MVKHNYLIWKPARCRDINGNNVLLDIPEYISIIYKGKLVSEILNMPRKKPLNFNEAVNLIAEKLNAAFSSGQIGRKPGQYMWYTENFVNCISDFGYHIELTGDEFEPARLSEFYL